MDYTRQKNVYGSPSHKLTNCEIKFIINNYYDMTINFKKKIEHVQQKRNTNIYKGKKNTWQIDSKLKVPQIYTKQNNNP